MAGQTLDYSDGDVTCEAYVAHEAAAGERRPCVLIAHQWAGPCDHERATADALARLGYVGFVADVFGKGVRGDPGGDNSALIGPYVADRALLRRRLLAAVAAAKAHPAVDPDRIAAIGYCFGGMCALDLARSATPDVKGAASFHGLFSAPGLGAQAPITAKVLILHGWDDPMAPPADVLAVAKELTDAGADWQLHAYGHAMHAFTAKGVDKPERGLRYDAAADRRSWAAMTAFLEEVFA
ncbi:dienelactone hydrolase family protein [Azospirillum sp. ST 5-10]|uniref:dienelactone hydrolase family protein n=1 Tax=unclassified Azospirillum TaxID=2630922 RepID=UPI003F49D418